MLRVDCPRLETTSLWRSICACLYVLGQFLACLGLWPLTLSGSFHAGGEVAVFLLLYGTRQKLIPKYPAQLTYMLNVYAQQIHGWLGGYIWHSEAYAVSQLDVKAHEVFNENRTARLNARPWGNHLFRQVSRRYAQGPSTTE